MGDADPFVKLSMSILRRGDLSNGEKLVYAYLLNRQGDNAECWPGLRTIARDCGCSVSGAERCVRRLEARGLIVVGRNAESGSNRYRVQAPTLCAPTFENKGVHFVEQGCPLLIKEKIQRKEPLKRTNERLDSTLFPGTERRPKPRFTQEQIEAVYAAYPRKIGKAAALKSINKALTKIAKRPDISDPAGWLLERVQMFAQSSAGRAGKFTPHPSTWFNQARFDDDPREWGKSNGNPDDNAARVRGNTDRFANVRMLRVGTTAPAECSANAQ